MKVETELLEDRQAKLVVTIEQELVDKAMKDAARRIARHVNIPGFRKGKAPYSVIVNYYGEGAVLEEALDPLGQDVYKKALEDSELEPYAPGVLSDMQLDPMTMTFTVPLRPEVDLGGYRDIRIPYEPEEVTEEDVREALENVRDQHATLDPVERAIEMGDVAMLDIVGTLVRDDDDTEEERPSTWVNRADVRVKITEDSTYPVPGFPAQVIGMAAGDEKSFDMSFPEEDEDLSEALWGKTLHFEVKCNEVYAFNPPDINDEFAKDHDYEDLAAMTAEIRNELEDAARRATRNVYLGKIFETLKDGVVTVKHPPVMLEEQIDRMLEDFDQSLRQSGMNLDEYKRMNNVDDAEIREDMREEAARQLTEALILGEVADVEELGVRDDEIDDEIETAILPYGAQAALMRQLFSSAEARRSLSSRILAQKSVDRLIAIAKGENPEIGEPEPEEPQADEEAEEPETPTESAALENGPEMAVEETDEVTADAVEESTEVSAESDESTADLEAEADDELSEQESNEDHMESDEETE